MQDCIFLLYYAWDTFCSTQGVARIVLFFFCGDRGQGADAEDSVLRYLSYHEVRVWAKDDGTATLSEPIRLRNHLAPFIYTQFQAGRNNEWSTNIPRNHKNQADRQYIPSISVYPNMSICPFSLNNKVQIVDEVTVCITWYCYSCFRQPYKHIFITYTWTYDVHKCPQDFWFTFWIRTWRFRAMWLHPPWRIRERLPETQVPDVADV